MIIKRLGCLAHEIKFKALTVITEPMSLIDNGFKKKGTKINGDMFLSTSMDYYYWNLDEFSQNFSITSPNVSRPLFISTPGEFSMKGVLVRRPLNEQFYILDYNDIRIVYIGFISEKVDIKALQSVSSVDVLLCSTGGDYIGADIDRIAKIVRAVDPVVVIPMCYVKEADNQVAVNSLEDFRSKVGIASVVEEKNFKLNSSFGDTDKVMKAVILK